MVLVIVYCLPSVTHSAPLQVCFEGVRVETVMPEIDNLVSGRIAVPGNPTSSQTEFSTLLASNASVAQNFCSARDGHHTVGAKSFRCAEVIFMPGYTGSGTAVCTILLSSRPRSVTSTPAESCTPYRPVRWHDHGVSLVHDIPLQSNMKV